MPTLKQISLKPGRDRPLLRHHPWIFSGAIRDAIENIQPGEIVRVMSADGKPLALASLNPHSRIAARVWSWEIDQSIDAAYVQRRIQHSIGKRRRNNGQSLPEAVRLVHGESDGLPGLIADWYSGVLVLQFQAWSVEAWQDVVISAFQEEVQPISIYERSDTEARHLEGLEVRRGLIRGKELPSLHHIRESGFKFWVDIAGGQKTGFYLDQSQNREVVGGLAQNRRVLDVFSYTSAFGVHALAGGASTLLSIESSNNATSIGEKNLAINGLADRQASWLIGDAFRVLRELRDRGSQFDMVILDPPKLAPTIRHVHRAARGYKDLNLLALKLLTAGGLLVTFSCSGGLQPELFQKIVADAALDAGRDVTILKRLNQPADHPVALNFPESAYLKGLVCLAD